mmetsp:Transcript_6095/g.6651  ORF Transcript_6095/g.6651 Transcript_6095/m.6651 type:complete len:95 (+) Transcript_6095:130-414(+)
MFANTNFLFSEIGAQGFFDSGEFVVDQATKMITGASINSARGSGGGNSTLVIRHIHYGPRRRRRRPKRRKLSAAIPDVSTPSSSASTTTGPTTI